MKFKEIPMPSVEPADLKVQCRRYAFVNKHANSSNWWWKFIFWKRNAVDHHRNIQGLRKPFGWFYDWNMYGTLELILNWLVIICALICIISYATLANKGYSSNHDQTVANLVYAGTVGEVFGILLGAFWITKFALYTIRFSLQWPLKQYRYALTHYREGTIITKIQHDKHGKHHFRNQGEFK